MLHCRVRVLLTLGMIALAVMFGSGAVGLRRVLVMLGGLVVLVSSHFSPLWRLLPQRGYQTADAPFVPAITSSRSKIALVRASLLRLGTNT